MRCYINALITGTDYCNVPLQRNVADDYIIRKMIRCSSNLGCHMQATVLCQVSLNNLLKYPKETLPNNIGHYFSESQILPMSPLIVFGRN